MQSDGLNSTLSPVVYGDIALSTKYTIQYNVFWLIVQGFCEVVIPLVHDPTHLKTIISVISAVIPSSTVPNTVSI